MTAAVFQKALVGLPDGEIVARVVRDRAPSGGQFDNARNTAFFNRQKGEGGLGIAPFLYARKRHNRSALEENGELVLERADKALLGGNADRLECMGRSDLLQQEMLTFHSFYRHRCAVTVNGRRLLKLRAAVRHAAFDELQVLDLPVDDGELLAQRDEGGIKRVAFHVRLDLIKGKAKLFHDADRVQIVELRGAVIAVAVLGVDVGGTEKADLVVKNQGLPGDILVL